MLKKKGIIVNDRIPNTEISSYYNFSDRYIPNNKPDVPWEYVGTIGLSWGYNKDQIKSDYMSVESLRKVCNDVI